MDVRGSEERGRWRQPDEGTGGVVRFAPPVPSPQPLSQRERGSSNHFDRSIAYDAVPSPLSFS